MSPLDDPDHSFHSDHILDWLEDTVSFLPSFPNDTYNLDETHSSYAWWDDHQQDEVPLLSDTSLNVTSDTTSVTVLDPLFVSESSKKRKLPGTPTSKPLKQSRCQISESTDSDAVVEEEVVKVKRTVSTKKVAGAGKGNGSNAGNRDGRWAEHLLNPCAVEITGGNLARVQHLLFVLHELASPSGDANHRLASHGLRALTHHLSPNSSSSAVLPITFASTEPKLFLRSLLKFYEINPWFTFPNTISNSSILQILAKESDCSRTVHIVDIGVSHGLQWPTLLEALSNRPGGPPPLLRLTIIVPASTQKGGGGVTSASPFSVGPVGDNLPSRLLRFAESINLNLQINVLNNHPLQELNLQRINTSFDETLIFCAQFRLHSLSHTTPDDRTNFLESLKGFEPKAVILCENDMECSCNYCGDFMTGFSRRVEYMWRFLDSTSAAFKGRECEERRVLEGEAAIGLMKGMNEGKEKWCEKMRRVGFVSEAFGEDALDGGRALLRKYDSNWEMKIDERNGCVCLWWKGQPVSFCSLWILEKSGDS